MPHVTDVRQQDPYFTSGSGGGAIVMTCQNTIKLQPVALQHATGVQ